MAYGLTFEGKNGNMMFSDNTPSMAYVGDASFSSWGIRPSHIGNRALYYRANSGTGYANYNFTAGSGATINVTFSQQQYTCTGGYYCCYPSAGGFGCDGYCCLGYGYVTVIVGNPTSALLDTARVAHYTVVSYARPTIFVYSTNSSCGANIVKVVNSGGTTWDITALLTYDGSTYTTAQSSVRLLAFGKVDPAYNAEGHGMFIKNATSQTMFHSDFEPCKVKDILTIDFASGGVSNPTQSYMTGSNAAVAALSQPAHQAVELGRSTRDISFQWSPGQRVYFYVKRVIAGLRWTGAKWVASHADIGLSESAGRNNPGGGINVQPSPVTVPIIDAADY